MRRDIKKQFWFNEKEAGALEEKANATCLTEAALVRLLVTGFIPVSKDNAKIYSLTKELSAIGNNINQIAVKCNSLGFAEKERLFKKVDELDKLQLKLETEFLSPKVDERWQ